MTKGIILLGIGLFAFLTLSQTPRALERGIRQYLQKTFPGSEAKVRVSAPLFWFVSGDLRQVSLQLAHFDASQFPIPTAGPQTSSGTSTPSVPPGSTVGSSRLSGEIDTSRRSRSSSGGPQVAGTDPRVRWARISKLALELSDFQYLAQHVTQFRADIPNVHYDFTLARKQRLLRLGGSGPGALQVTLSESDLNTAVTMDRADVRGLHVLPEAGRLRVNLDYHTLLGWVPVSVTGRLAVVDGHAIWLTDPAISAVHVPLPQAVTDYIIKRVENLNPVFDLDRLHLPMSVSLTGAESTPDGVIVHGAIQIPGE